MRIIGRVALSVFALVGVASPAAADAVADFYAGKQQACCWFFRWELPKVDAQLDLLATLDTTTLDMQDNWF